MGSTGSNTFGNYGPNQTTKCDESIDAALEDVARHPYYKKNGKVPAVGTAVQLGGGIVDGRIVVEDAKSHLVIGSLPTAYNYLRLCLAKKYQYAGKVTVSKGKPVPSVEVHLDSV